MFWQEDEDKNLPYQIPDDVLDISFSIACKTLPLDHAWALSQAVQEHLPWMKEDKVAGIHQIHVAESNNGWIRPENDDGALLHPSRRTKMTLRIPFNKLEETQSLTGKVLNIADHSLHIGKSKKKALSNASVIFSRYVLCDDNNETENQFLSRIANEIKAITGITIKKMLCGKSHHINTPTEKLLSRQLMIADLDSEPSIKIQQLGLGNLRILGCGIFMPHKGIKSLNSSE